MIKRGLTVLVMVCFSAWLIAKNCNLTSTGAVPLPDLGANLYNGSPGGLYPNGQNTIPAAHLQAGLSIAGSIQPLNAQGNPDENGKIVLISIGMSNAAQEFGTGSESFLSRVQDDPSLNPKLEIVSCAQPGQTIPAWMNPSSTVYDVCNSRLAAQGLTPEQVQIAWIKQAEAATAIMSFPDHVLEKRNRLAVMVRVVKQRYPNLAISHLSSRTRAYEDHPNALNPEPIAYENGFVAKWLIEDQINGEAGLNFNPANGAVVAPWLAWGPYLWVDGLAARSDGLTWICDDTAPDGVHPSQSGVWKVADQLIAFYKTDPTTAPWFLKPERDFSIEISTNVVSNEPFVVDFTASAAGGTPVEYSWSFGDALHSNSRNPRKTYYVAGAYSVNVTARDSAGNLATDQLTLQVTTDSGNPPSAPTNLRIAPPQ